MQVFSWINQYIKRYRLWMALGMLLILITTALGLVNPKIAGQLVDQVIIGKKTEMLLGFLAIMMGATLIRTGIRYVYQLVFETVSQRITLKIREQIYQKVQEMDFGFYDRTRTGDIMARMTGDLDAVRHFLAWVIYSIFENVMIFVVAVVFLFSINYKLALVLVLVAPLIGFFTGKMSTRVKPVFGSIREQFSRLNSVVQENISGNRVVKAFTKEGYEIDKFSKENEEFRQKNLDASKIWATYLPIIDSLASVLNVLIILVGGIMVIDNSLTYGELITFNGFVWALNNPMRMSGWLVNDVQRFAASADKIISILNEEPAIKSPENPVKVEAIKGKIEFKNVSFEYGEENILKNVSFTVEAGQTVAFIGPTGSGKSTIMSLIGRFYDCRQGDVLIDDINIKRMDLTFLRESISMAMQDIFLFSDTIEGNIAYGVPNALFEDVERMAGVADAHHFITAMPDGYDTIIGERGVGLSGGQKQRIALARALLKNPSIMILDDTTSSVDVETEQEIHTALKSFYSDKTTLMIAHRISSVKNCDMIYVLEGGSIIEQGRHEALLAMKGYYYSVYKSQLGDFDDMPYHGVVQGGELNGAK